MKIEPRTHEKDCAVRSGVLLKRPCGEVSRLNPGLTKRMSVDQTQDQKNIVYLKARAERTNEFHVEGARWIMDDGQTDGLWPDQPKNG